MVLRAFVQIDMLQVLIGVDLSAKAFNSRLRFFNRQRSESVGAAIGSPLHVGETFPDYGGISEEFGLIVLNLRLTHLIDLALFVVRHNSRFSRLYYF